MQTGQIETFRDISVVRNHPRHIAKVLEQESALIKVDGKLAGTAARPRAHAAVTAGDPDPFSDHFKKRYASVSAVDLPDDGLPLTRQDVSVPTLEATEKGMYALLRTDLFNLLCIPPLEPKGATEIDAGLVDDAIAFCEKRRAFFLIDPPWHRGADVAEAVAGIKRFAAGIRRTSHAALYFPTLMQPNPINGGRLEEFAPCGAIAGVIARTDGQRGVWKAPAGLEATLVGVAQLSVPLSDHENAELNPLGINCLRTFSGVRHVAWGARTIQGNDQFASEWKYVPVRRMALFLEESLHRGTQWVVFEPNDESLWAEVRLSVGAFLLNLFRQGAFQGRTPKEAYFVKCDGETTTPTDVNLGFVNILVGFAPLKPAEFVVIRITQMAGQVVS
jgi:phage tail sheath protein FI